jgi:selenocysteine-specific elongation factor
MKAAVMGTAGHVDHGKTSLVKVLTGVDTDRWSEEKRRGLTIDIGFARLEAGPGLEVGVVDVPGHEDFVKNMLAGSTGIDFLLLVVAADEGPMPQTREHLLIGHLLGIAHGVVALTKVDRVDAEWRELAREAVRDELRRLLGHADWPVIEVSAITGEGLAALRAEIVAVAGRVHDRDSGDYFRMPVDRSFSVRGAGTVVTGTTWSGELSLGESIRILPGDSSARVRSLQVHGEERKKVGPGRRCALALVGVQPADAPRGSVIVRERCWRSVRRLGSRLEVPAQSPRAIENGQRVRLYLGTREVMARVRLWDRERLERGDTTWAVLEGESTQVARVGDRFVLRFYSPVATVAGGVVAELEPPSGWRRRARQWEGMLGGPTSRLEASVSLAAGKGVLVDELPLRTGLSPGMLEADPASGIRRIGHRWYPTWAQDEARAAMLDALREAHRTNRRASAEALESIRSALSPRYSDDLLASVIADLSASGELVVRGPWIRLPEHSATLIPEEQRGLRKLREALEEAGLEPPAPAELDRRLGLDRSLRNDLLRLLVEQGEVVPVTPEIFLAVDVEDDLRKTARQVLGDRQPATPTEFKEAFGVSRKYLIPLLEYLDRVGVTRRTIDGRVSAE